MLPHPLSTISKCQKFPDKGGTWGLVIFYGPLLSQIIPLHSHPKKIIDPSTVFQHLTL